MTPLLLLDMDAVEVHRGVPRQLVSQLKAVFVEMIRRHHVMFSIFMAHDDAHLSLTLAQRVTILACLVLTSMCVTAMLLGRRPDQTQVCVGGGCGR